MESNRSRYAFLDLARGIAILCVVLGHAYSPGGGQIVVPLIYSFHMPFFFLISGVLLGKKSDNKKSLSLSIVSKFKTLLLPYVFWGLFCQLFNFALAMIGGASFKEQLALRLHEITTLTNGAMWFLITMFFAQILFWFAVTVLKKPYVYIPFAIALLLIAIFVPSLPTVLGTDVLRSCVGCFFMIIGFCARELFFKKVKLPYLLLLSVVNVCLIFLNGTISIAALSFGNPVLCIVNGCLGSWLLVQYCMHLCDIDKMSTVLKSVTVWGKYSVVILCLHFLVIECVRTADHILFRSVLPTLSHAEGPIMTVIVMLLFSIAMPLLLHVFSWSWGLKRPEKSIYRS